LKSLRNKSAGPELQSQLLSIMQNFMDSADNYYKEKCYGFANKCTSMASLVGLQLRVPDTRMINLTDNEIVQLMIYRGNFDDTLILARAYKKNFITDWIGPLYQQVIVCSNFAYFDDYLNTFPPASEMFLEMSKKFKSDPKNTHFVPQFKQFLGYMTDQFLKYDICKDIGFEDLVNETLSACPGILYFKENK